MVPRTQQANKPTSEELQQQFRSSLEDALGTAEKLSAHCSSIEEMCDVIRLALTNDAQLRILGTVIFPQA